MKKIMFCVAFLFCLSCLVNAQTNKISKGKVTYVEIRTLNAIGDYKKYSVLLFENNRSVIKSIKAEENPLINNSENKIEKEASKGIDEQGREVVQKEEKITKVIDLRGQGSKIKYRFYKDFQKKELFSHNILIESMDFEQIKHQDLIIKEKLPDFGWQITQEKKKIEGYECFKAISKPFRGRTYIAWFCPEIPIPDGPWKLCGLPGLILEAQDEKNEVKFIAQKIELQVELEKVENKLLENNFPLLTWEEYKEKYKENEQKRANYLKSRGMEVKSMKMKIDLESLDD